jgi:hypothetical protein
MKRCLLSFLIIMGIFSLQNIYAQVTTLSEGDKVRIWKQDPLAGSITGQFSRLGPDTLQLYSYDRIVQIPISDISRIDVSIGTKRNTFPGLIFGSVLGALAGIAMSSGSNRSSDSGGWDLNYLVIDTGTGAIIGGLLGGLIGGLAGHSMKVNRWSQVPLNNILGVKIRFYPGNDLAGIQIKLAF